MSALVLTLVGLQLMVIGGVDVSIVYDKLFGIITCAVVTALFLTIAMYHKSITAPKDALSQAGQTGNMKYSISNKCIFYKFLYLIYNIFMLIIQ